MVRSYLVKLVPAAFGGIVAGAVLLRVIDDTQLRLLIALIVVATVGAGAVATWRPLRRLRGAAEGPPTPQREVAGSRGPQSPSRSGYWLAPPR